jgi:hypothetical protein
MVQQTRRTDEQSRVPLIELIVLVAVLTLAVLSVTLGWNQISARPQHNDSAVCVTHVSC